MHFVTETLYKKVGMNVL